MAKKIVSLLCALAMLATMVVVSAFSASAAYSESMAGFTGANTHCVKYGAGSNGNFDGYANPTVVGQPPRYIDTEHFSKGILTIGGSTGLRTVTTGEIGTYSMSAFQIDVDYFTCRSNVAERAVIRVGDLSVYVVQAYDGGAWRNAFTLSATYGADALTLSETTIIPGCLSAYNDGGDGSNMMTAAEVQAEMKAYSESLDPVTYFQDGVGRSVNQLNKIRLVYENGTLTITTPDAITEAGQAWSSTATITGADFENADVSCELWACASGIKTQMLCNFVGSYTPISSGSALLQPAGATLAVDTDETKSTAIEVYYDKAEIDAAATAPFVRASVGGTDTDLAALDTTTISGTDYYVAIFTNITPNYFGTDVTFTVGDGTTLVGDPFTYSVKQYCQNKLADSTSSAALKTVCTDILVYGEAVRAYVGTPDASITDGVDLSAATTSHANGSGIETSGDGAYTFAGFALTMRENIFLTATVNYADGLENCTLACQVDGGDNYYLSAGAAVNVADLDMWYEYRIPVGVTQAYNDCTVYLINADGDTVSKTVTLSMADIARYYEVNGASDAEKNLGTAILNYATSIAAL